MNLLGHIMQLPDNCPIKLSLKEVLQPCKDKRGRPKHTWISTIKNVLKKVNIDVKHNYETYEKLVELSSDRSSWKNIISDVLMHF